MADHPDVKLEKPPDLTKAKMDDFTRAKVDEAEAEAAAVLAFHKGVGHIADFTVAWIGRDRGGGGR